MGDKHIIPKPAFLQECRKKNPVRGTHHAEAGPRDPGAPVPLPHGLLPPLVPAAGPREQIGSKVGWSTGDLVPDRAREVRTVLLGRFICTCIYCLTYTS